MNIYDVYNIINLDKFNATNLPSREVTGDFGLLGQQTVLVTKGNLVSFLFNNVYLPLNLNDKNPFEFEGYAIFIDPNNDIWLGIKTGEN